MILKTPFPDLVALQRDGHATPVDGEFEEEDARAYKVKSFHLLPNFLTQGSLFMFVKSSVAIPMGDYW